VKTGRRWERVGANMRRGKDCKGEKKGRFDE
jgi:hypothetical protein